MVTNGMSLNVEQMVPSMFTSKDRLLTRKGGITIDSYISTAFDKVVEAVEIEQDCVQYGKCIEKPMNIKVPFKYEVSSMEFCLELFRNDDVD